MKRTLLKKLLFLTFAFILIFPIGGCYAGTAAKERGQGEKIGLKLIEYINDEDTDSIVELFSEKVQDHYDLKKETEAFYDVLGSDIKSYGRLQSQDVEDWYDDGKLTHAIIIVTLYDVITKDGKKFDELSFTYIAVDKDKNIVGVESLSLSNDDKDVSVVGGYFE